MIRQLIAVGFFTGIVLAGSGETLSQSASASVPVAVNQPVKFVPHACLLTHFFL